LAEFVGRVYLLLVTVVYDHPRWLPKDLREGYKAALADVYPSVYELQTVLLNPERDPRGAAEVRQRLRDAGLSGAQLELKLGAYLRAEAWFYGGRNASDTVPDRRFHGQEDMWRLATPDVEVLPDDVTSGSKRRRLKSLVDPAFSAANITLGTLLSVFQVAEPYKEIKEGVEFGVRNGKLMRRLVAGVGRRVTRIVNFGARGARVGNRR
jgi:hypothetical protein